MRWLPVFALVLTLGCGGGSSGGDNLPPLGGSGNPGGGGNPTPPPPAGTTVDQAQIPNGASVPVGVTYNVGFTENVSLASMQSFFASLVAANNALWNITEGQVRIDRIRFFDNVAPGVRTTQYMFNPFAIDTSNLDIVVWPPATWDAPGSAAVGEQPGEGRNGRLMIIQDNASTFVLVHESGHMLFRLTWSPGNLLVDEYNDGVQDPACVMESENLPQRFCSDTNHVNQQPQPHSCWRQILADYPSFSHSGTDTAPSLPPAPQAEYNDTP